MQRGFKVILEWNEDGCGYTVIVPSLPGCITEGDTVEEAMNNAQEAITGYLEALKLQGKPLPKKDTRMLFGEVDVTIQPWH